MAEAFERLGLCRGEAAAGGIENADAADGDALARVDGGGGVEAEAAVADGDTTGRVVRVAAGVGNLVDAVAHDGGFTGDEVAGRAGDLDAEAAGEGDLVALDEGDGAHGRVAKLGGEASEVVHRRIVGHVGEVVLLESLEARALVVNECLRHEVS